LTGEEEAAVHAEGAALLGFAAAGVPGHEIRIAPVA
jgi:hypothetical protein